MKNETIRFQQPLSYRQRLASHIDDYIDTVLQSPAVRAGEFAQLRAFAGLVDPKLLLEVPAEGHMLEQVFPGAVIERADFLRLRLAGYSDNVVVTDWLLKGIPSGRYDALLAVVPFHHASAEQKRQFIEGAFRVIRPGGVLAFAEVDRGSPVHRFLDGFVNAHTATGHRGEYPDASFVDVMDASGFLKTTSAVLPCPWVFESDEHMHAYLTQLLGLRRMPVADLLQALEDGPGLQRRDARVSMNWALRYFRAARPAQPGAAG